MGKAADEPAEQGKAPGTGRCFGELAGERASSSPSPMFGMNGVPEKKIAGVELRRCFRPPARCLASAAGCMRAGDTCMSASEARVRAGDGLPPVPRLRAGDGLPPGLPPLVLPLSAEGRRYQGLLRLLGCGGPSSAPPASEGGLDDPRLHSESSAAAASSCAGCNVDVPSGAPVVCNELDELCRLSVMRLSLAGSYAPLVICTSIECLNECSFLVLRRLQLLLPLSTPSPPPAARWDEEWALACPGKEPLDASDISASDRSHGSRSEREWECGWEPLLPVNESSESPPPLLPPCSERGRL